MRIVNLDPYYSVSFYNECLQAMQNNKVPFTEFYYKKGSAGAQMMLGLDSPPIMVNYDELLNADRKYLVTKVIPFNTADSVILSRRTSDVLNAIRPEFYLNDALKSVNDFAAFVNIKSHEDSLRISKISRLWYFGKIKNFRVHLVTNPHVLPFLNPDDILLRKDDNSVLEFEQKFNAKILRTVFLKKYSRTPYYENSVLHKVS